MNNDSTLHIRLNLSLKNEIEEIAKNFNLNPSAIVRMAIEEFIDRKPQPTTIALDSRININKI